MQDGFLLLNVVLQFTFLSKIAMLRLLESIFLSYWTVELKLRAVWKASNFTLLWDCDSLVAVVGVTLKSMVVGVRLSIKL